MQVEKLREAAGAMLALQRQPQSLHHLPEGCQPQTIDDALAIQDAVIAAWGEKVAGWKISINPEGRVMRGALLGSRVKPSPAVVPAASVPLLGVEAEIAFELRRDLPPRATDYTRDEIEAAVVPVPAIEIVDSRFVSYQAAPPLDRTADFMSNGGFVHGPAVTDWHGLDLASIEVALEVDGETLVQRRGGHPTSDPLLPAIALINVMRETAGLKAGQILTTGTYTGLNFVKPGQTVVVRFAGFQLVSVTFSV